MRKFIEITSDDHDHGGEGWEYGINYNITKENHRGISIKGETD